MSLFAILVSICFVLWIVRGVLRAVIGVIQGD